MKANQSTWLKSIGLVLVMIFMLVSCNFPLSSRTSGGDTGAEDVQQTVLALQ